MAACCTVAQAAPPPWWMRLKKRMSPTPRLRAISISGLVSIVNVTKPSTSAGCTPASASAAAVASTASRISLRPESLENSVAPMPAIAARSRRSFTSPSRRQHQADGARHVVAQAVGAAQRHLDLATLLGGHAAGELHGVARVVRRAQADGDLLEHGVGAGPVGDEAADEAVGAEDV